MDLGSVVAPTQDAEIDELFVGELERGEYLVEIKLCYIVSLVKIAEEGCSSKD